MRYAIVAFAGALGAVARYALDGWVSDRNAGQFPWGTMAVNLLGAFLLGVVVALTTERLVANPNWRLGIGVGFLGAFTTFSTYAYETVKLAEDGAVSLAFLNAFGMLAAGLLAAFAGLAAGRSL